MRLVPTSGRCVDQTAQAALKRPIRGGSFFEAMERCRIARERVEQTNEQNTE